MPIILGVLGKVLASTIMTLLTSLVTEKFVKKLVVSGLERLVVRTKSDADDKLLEEAKKIWGE